MFQTLIALRNLELEITFTCFYPNYVEIISDLSINLVRLLLPFL